MSTSISVIYAPGRSVSVKTTPTTTLQAILVSACAGMPKPPSPDSYTLVYNSKALDLTLPLRFANLPQGAKLTLTPRTRSSPSTPSKQVASPKATAPAATVKVALQLVGSSRIIADFESSATLWDIIVAAQTSSGRTLNLVNKFRPAEPPATSPLSGEGKSGWGSGFLQTLISATSGSSSPKLQPQQPVTPPVAQSWYYQQPVLLLLNKEYATNYDLQHTTLRSLGFTSGSVMVRFSYRPAKEPTSLADVSRSQAANVASPVSETASAQPLSPPVATLAQTPAIEEAGPPTNALGIAAAPVAALSEPKDALPILIPSEPKVGLPLLLSTRQVSVLAAPPADVPALGSRIVLPESFYEAGSDDLRILVSVQKARVAESEKGFSSRVKQEEENRRRQAEFKAKHPRALIRFRFPDQVQVQATFSSHEETVAELYAFLNRVLVRPNLLESLIIQPPAQNLDTLRNETLFNAKLAPAAVVHVKLAGAKVSTLEVLKPEVASLVEDLKIPSPQPIDDRILDASVSTETVITSPVKDDAPQAPLQPPAHATTSKYTTADGPKMPKWFLAGQKR